MTATAPPKVKPLLGQSVLTRDGVRLITDIYCPPGEGPFPTLYMRTPWNSRTLFLLRLAGLLAAQGFSVVLQNTRGRYGSGGEFSKDDPAETADGVDTLRWMAGQPWCDGNVGLLGFCYGCYSAYGFAAEEVPGVKVRAVAAVAGFSNAYRQFFRDGVLQLHWALPFNMMIKGEQQEDIFQHKIGQMFSHLPLGEIPQVMDRELPMWEDTLTDNQWHRRDMTRRFLERPVPVLHILGWHDFQAEAAMYTYRSLLDCGVPQRLVAGPWDHRSIFRVLSRHANREAMAEGEPNLFFTIIRWMERWLRPATETAADAEPSVQYAVSNTGEWRTGAVWPPPEATGHRLYLGAGRSLNEQPPALTGQDTWLNDPLDPVPTVGGQVWPIFRVVEPGPEDQRPVQARPDVLTYRSAPLKGDLRIAGTVSAELFAGVDALDADLHAKLVAIRPDGSAPIICEGTARLSYLVAQTGQQVEPGACYQLTVSLGSTAYQFGAGDRIGLEIAGANFPKYVRNQGTGLPMHTDPGGKPFRQVLWYSPEQLAALELPLLDPWPGFEA